MRRPECWAWSGLGYAPCCVNGNKDETDDADFLSPQAAKKSMEMLPISSSPFVF